MYKFRIIEETDQFGGKRYHIQAKDFGWFRRWSPCRIKSFNTSVKYVDLWEEPEYVGTRSKARELLEEIRQQTLVDENRLREWKFKKLKEKQEPIFKRTKVIKA